MQFRPIFNQRKHTDIEEWSPCLLTETEWEEGSVFITCYNQTKSESWNGLDMRWHVVIIFFPHSLDAWTPQPSTNFIFQAVIGSPNLPSPVRRSSMKTIEKPWNSKSQNMPKKNSPTTVTLIHSLKKSGHGTVIPSSCASMAVEPTWAHHEFLWVPPLWHGTHCDMNFLFASDDLMVLGEPCQRHR